MNTAWNEKALEKFPHRDFLDLSVIYMVQKKFHVPEGYEISARKIDHGLATTLGMTEQDLYEQAVKNMRSHFKPVIKPIEQGLDGFCPDDIPKFIYEFCLDNMYIVQAEDCCYSAGAVVLPEILEDLSALYHSNYYLIPGSTDGWIAKPVMSPEDDSKTSEIVRDTNKMIPKGNRLADHAYMYDQAARELIIV